MYKRQVIEYVKLIVKRDFKTTLFAQNFLVATFFSFVLILFIKDVAFKFGRAPLIIGLNFIFFGALMYWADLKLANGLDLTRVKNWKASIIIGLSQSLAVFPGVSRSGITLTTSRYLGMTRLEASRFSFLLSLPVILGSIIFKLPDIIAGNATPVSFSLVVIGILSSFFFGLITIHFFLKVISKVGLKYFSFYRIIIGSVLIYLSLR